MVTAVPLPLPGRARAALVHDRGRYLPHDGFRILPRKHGPGVAQSFRMRAVGRHKPGLHLFRCGALVRQGLTLRVHPHPLFGFGGFGVFFCFFDHMRHPYQCWMKGILWGKDQLWTSLRLPPCAPLQNFFLRKWAGRTLAGGGAACGKTRTAWARSAPQAITERGAGGTSPPWPPKAVPPAPSNANGRRAGGDGRARRGRRGRAGRGGRGRNGADGPFLPDSRGGPVPPAARPCGWRGYGRR